jgi:Outer membrane protein beta-barrel domain
MNGRVLSAVFVAAVFVFVPASALAQQLGIKAGANFASLTPEEDEDPDTSRRLGLVAGVWIRTAPTTRFSFQAEGLFSEKGVKFDNIPFDVDSVATVDIRVRYLEIPLLARIGFGDPGSTTRFFVVGGATPAFRLSARAKAEVGGEQETRDISDDIEPFDLGLAGGVGVEFGRALIEARYTHGLRHINTDDNGDEDRIKNRVFSVMAGVRFR